MTLNQKTVRQRLNFFRKILVALFFVMAIKGQSQSSARTSTTETKSNKEMSIGLNLGVSNGIGVDFAYRLAKHWSGRVAYNYAQYSKNGYTYDINSTNPDGTKYTQTISFDAAVKLSNLALNMEYTPGAKEHFKLLGGLSYFPNNTITVGGELISTIKFNDVQLNPEDLGSGIVTIGFKNKIAPFVGMGFGRTFPRKRMNVSFDLGAYYKGDYKVNIDVKPGALLEENESNATILERNFNQKFAQKVWPIMNFRLAYRIK